MNEPGTKGNEMNKPMTTAELLAADAATLTIEQIQQRSLIVNLRKLEREAEMVEHQNVKFQEDKEERARKMKLRTDDIEAERQKIANEQAGCRHMTGGSGLAGFFSGDGSIYGSSTSVLELPTGERYILCFRCQREWHRPSKRAVIDGKLTLAQYQAEAEEFEKMLRVPRKSFDALNGEFCAASKFTIPKLIKQQQQDDADFAVFLESEKGKREHA